MTSSKGWNCNHKTAHIHMAPVWGHALGHGPLLTPGKVSLLPQMPDNAAAVRNPMTPKQEVQAPRPLTVHIAHAPAA